jgi:hypothetical protein
MGMDFTMGRINYQPFIIRLINQGIQQLFPHTLIAPANETAVRVAPSAVIRRQITPRRTCTDDPGNRYQPLSLTAVQRLPEQLKQPFPHTVQRRSQTHIPLRTLTVQGRPLALPYLSVIDCFRF